MVTVAVKVTSAIGSSAPGKVTLPELSITSVSEDAQAIVAAPPHAVVGSVSAPSVMDMDRLPSSPLAISRFRAACKSAINSSLMDSSMKPAASSSLRAKS